MKRVNLNAIKNFAEENFNKDEHEQFFVEDPEFAVTNPWMDHTGRFELTDEEAVKEWGLELIVDFCIGAIERLN